jgi:trehalose-phosphatase
MRNLLDHVDDFLRAASEARHVGLLTDFDGTLVPAESRPDQAQLPDRTRDLLRDLARHPRITVAVISGRALDDLRVRIGIERIWYVGNHGYEIASPDGKVERLFDPEELEVLRVLEEELRRETAGIPGVLFEPKGPILALHVRGVPSEELPRVESIFQSAVEQHRRRLMVDRGPGVFEARLRGSSNKGASVRRIHGTLPSGTLTVYAGDDRTDQDAFRAVRGRGISVAVVPASELADYAAAAPAEWIGVLERLREILQARPAGPRPARPRKRRE